jgi:hypothetical protein
MLWPTVNRFIHLGVGHPFGAHDQVLLFLFFCREIALLFVLGCPLWREDRSAICSAICQWLVLRRTHNHTLLSHLRLLGSLSVACYNSQGLITVEVFWPASTRGGELLEREMQNSSCACLINNFVPSTLKQFPVLQGVLISLWLYNENNTLEDWKNVFILHISPWAPHIYNSFPWFYLFIICYMFRSFNCLQAEVSLPHPKWMLFHQSFILE